MAENLILLCDIRIDQSHKLRINTVYHWISWLNIIMYESRAYIVIGVLFNCMSCCHMCCLAFICASSNDHV